MIWAANPAWQVPGQGWWQVLNLVVALVLCGTIGLERELRYRDAGLRTQTLVGVAAALFMLVSKYGFFDVLGDDVILDPSRVAAQIVSGIGFIGAGLIFVRRNAVRGLTTAAVVWLSAAVGTAAGAGLPLLAAAVTASHFVVVYGMSPLARRLPRSKYALRDLRVEYAAGVGALRQVIARCTELGFTVEELKPAQHEDEPPEAQQAEYVTVLLQVRGKGSLSTLASELDVISGVRSITTGSRSRTDD